MIIITRFSHLQTTIRFIILLFFLAGFIAACQGNDISNPEMRATAETKPAIPPVPPGVIESTDSHTVQPAYTGTEYIPLEFDQPAYTQYQNQSSAWYRLQSGMQMPETHHPRITTQLKQYLKRPGYLQRVMERARPVLPFILNEIEARQLPTELALLPIVESAYQAFAYSPGRASGLWQIIPSTGRFLGLQQNWWYDGRRDLIDSTRAALTYLENLSDQFNGDWELALAAYNAGPGTVRKAIKYNQKRNRQTDFWHLTKLAKETRAYVPKLLALKTLFGNPAAYGLDLLPIDDQVKFEIVDTGGQIDLALAAEMAGITIKQLYQLNPAFNRWATAPEGPHRLLLPQSKSAPFKQALQTLPAEKRIKWVRHKIKNGETLSHLSLHYRTTTALIKQVNKIQGSRIHAGQFLMIPTAAKSLHTYTMSKDMRLSKIQKAQRTGNKQIHIVRAGQSLWSISKNYQVSIAALARWNGIAPIDTLRIGQKLVIWHHQKTTKPLPPDFIQNSLGPDRGLYELRYTVRQGDSLSRIADQFNIRLADIKRWNQLGKYLQPGQKLKLYIDVTQQSG